MAINFNDDIVFFSSRGMEGINGDITTEQAVAHRSSLVDRKLVAEPDYNDMVLEEWEGYLLAIVGRKVYLADSRALYTNDNHNEYEWFYWELGKTVTCAKVYNGVLYLGTEDGVYTLTDNESSVESYWVTPKGEYKKRMEELKKLYEGIEGTNIENELTADLIGDYLFTDSDFVSRLSTEKLGLFKRIFEEIKYLIKTATAGSKQARELEKVKRVFEKAYKENGTANNVESGIKYSLAKDASVELHKALYDKTYESEVLLRDETPAIMLAQKGVKNLPMAMNASHIRENIFTEEEAKELGLRVDKYINYHGLGEEFFLQVIDGLDDVKLAYRGTKNAENSPRRENYFLLISQFKDSNGDTVNVPVYINEHALFNRVFVDVNKISTVFGRKNFEEYIKNQVKKGNLVRIKNRSNQTSESPTPIVGHYEEDASKNIIPQNEEKSSGEQKNSLGEDISTIGNYNVSGKDIALGPIREDVAPVQQRNPVREDIGPIRKKIAPTERVEERTAPISQQAIKKSYEQSEDKSFYQFVVDALAGKLQGKSFHKLSQKISARMAKDIESLVGFSVERYSNEISQNHIKHIEARHGANGVADHSMENLHDVARMGYVIDYYDKMEKGKLNYEYKNSDGSPSQTVVLQKKIDDNYYYVVEAVPDAKLKTLHVVSAYINKNDTLSEVGVQNALNPDARNESQSSVSSSDISIPQNEGNASEYKENAPVQQAYSPDELPAWDDVAKRQPEAGTYAPVQENFPVRKATTVKEQNAKKLQSLKIRLQNEQAHMEQMHANFNAELRELQAEYDSKKNKNTKLAQTLLARMERRKTLRDSADADYEKRISDLKDKIDKMSSEKFKTAEQRQAKAEELQSWARELMGDTSTWKDKKWGLLYKINTLHRNLRDIVRGKDGKSDIDRADAIYDALQGTYNHNQAEKNREANAIKEPYAEKKITSAEDAYIQMLGEYKYNPDSTITDEVLTEYYEKHKRKIDINKVNEVIESARKLYDELFVRVNAVLKEHGMKQLEYREGYFPHFTEDRQSFVAKLFDWKTKNDLIPTDIAGLTEEFKPNKSYQSFDKHRTGDTTDYSFKKGLDMYVEGALDWIYHIEDIQKRRAFENEIRYRHSEKGIQEKIEAIQNNTELNADEAQAQMELVYADARNPLNNFVTDFRTQTNTLAGKKHSMDRGMEDWTNRKSYSIMTNVANRISANMVVGSISSALTNFIPITQSWGEVAPIWSLRAAEKVIKNFKSSEDIQKSDFLTNRLNQSENLYKTAWDKAGKYAGILMEGIDNFTSRVVWGSKYLQNLSEGMSENEAIKNADQFAENVMAGRSKGNTPTLFDAKNPLVKVFTAFQLEVNNQYGYLFKDLPQEIRNKSLGKLAQGYGTMFVGAFFYNMMYSALTGRNAALDPIGMVIEFLEDLGVFGEDEKEEPEEVVANLVDSVLDEVPFVGGLLGGGRIPLSSALPYGSSGSFAEGAKSFVQDIADAPEKGVKESLKSIGKEMVNPLLYLALPMGGSQIRKTVQGVKMFDDDLPIAGSYTDSGNLRFPVEDTLWNKVQAALFGQWASGNAREYVEEGRSPLGEKQIQELVDTELPIAEYWKYRDGLKRQDTLGEKIDYIASLNLPISTKNILANNVTTRKTPIDLTRYDEFADYEGFDDWVKNSEKYEYLEKRGISPSEYQSFDEEKQKAWDKIYQKAQKKQK